MLAIARMYRENCTDVEGLSDKIEQLQADVAETGNPMGIFNVGASYHFGRGIPQDCSKAMEWYLKAN